MDWLVLEFSETVASATTLKKEWYTDSDCSIIHLISVSIDGEIRIQFQSLVSKVVGIDWASNQASKNR